MKFVTTNLLKIFLFTFIIGILVFSIDGVNLKCSGFIRKKPPCTLFINVHKDKFLLRVGGLIPGFLRQKYQSFQNYRRKSVKQLNNMNEFASEMLNQKTIQTICRRYSVRYQLPTYIKFIAPKRRFNFRRRSRSLAE
uniref:Uncharacterized protein n=1 Tax=Strongyloides stercoralis TaxID=6248 RepID=A0A0K0EFM6_STRER